MDVNNSQTELDLLNLLIKCDYNSVEEFAKAIGMSRQHLTRIKKKAKGNNGILDDDFKIKLKGLDINLYKWKKNPSKGTKKNDDDDLIYIKKDTLTTLLLSQQRTIEGQQGTLNSQQETIQYLTIHRAKKSGRVA